MMHFIIKQACTNDGGEALVAGRNFARYRMHLARITFDNFAAALRPRFSCIRVIKYAYN